MVSLYQTDFLKVKEVWITKIERRFLLLNNSGWWGGGIQKIEAKQVLTSPTVWSTVGQSAYCTSVPKGFRKIKSDFLL